MMNGSVVGHKPTPTNRGTVTGTAVVALGGNAITAEGEAGTYEEQRANADVMARSIVELIDDGWRVVIVHGNGPQVGNLAIQQDRGRDAVPEMPLFALDAMTQGQLGSLMAIALYRAGGGRHHIVGILSHVIVDLNDPAFNHPTKPIGPFYSQSEATRLAETRGWDIVEDSGRGYRRVVPSPRPGKFVEIQAVRSLLDAGHVVVADGGGGIPVARQGDLWDGVDAVIDTVGEPTWELSLKAVKPGGVVVVPGSTGGPNPPAQLNRIRVRVPDRPRVLARITQILGAAQINLEDFELRHESPEYGGVLVILVAGADNAARARELLRREGFAAA